MKWNIRHKLQLGFAVIGLLTLSMGVLALWEMRGINQEAIELGTKLDTEN